MAENKNRMNNEPVFGSLAYDLNTLNWEQLDGNAVRQPQEPLRRPERDIRPQREPRRRPAARPREHASPILVGGVAVLALMVVVLMMGYVKLTQASYDLTAKQSQLQQVQEERVALGVAYEKAFDQAAVKAAAQAAGIPATRSSISSWAVRIWPRSVVPKAPDPWPRHGPGSRTASARWWNISAERRHIVKTRKE